MMFFFCLLIKCLCMAVAMGTLTFHRTGWLDRVVQFYSNNFIEDFRKLPLVPIKASLEPAPPGYIDSPKWDYSSVMWLLTLLEESPKTQEVRRAIRRSMQSSRRFMRIADSLKMFPSMNKLNDMYYDFSYEMPTDTTALTPVLDDDSIIYVSNPVEARLPSGSISVRLLREILENRASAARYIPSTFKDKYTWGDFTTKSNATGAASTQATGEATGTTGGDNNGSETTTGAPS